MAMNPPSTSDSDAQGPSAGGDDGQDSGGMDMSQGYCIELKVKADGSMTVGVEPLSEEDSEEGSDPSDPSSSGNSSDPSDPDSGSGDDDAQPVSSLGEAIRVIKDIVAHAGDISDMANSQDAMSSGYGKAGS